MDRMDLRGLRVTHVESMAAVDRNAWNRLVLDADPFVSHEWLSVMESSGGANQEAGWQPRHLTLTDPSGRLVAATPLYLKRHSEAEFGADFGWSIAHDRAVGAYYPKLQCEAPLTPLPGPRLLVGSDPGADARRQALAAALLDATSAARVSSVHVNFLNADDMTSLKAVGFTSSIGIHYVWHNKGYASFDEFLTDVKTDYRNNLRRERRHVAASGLRLETVEGSQITEEIVDAFMPLYASTYIKYGERPRMTNVSFREIHERMADRLRLALAWSGDRLVAGVFSIRSPRSIALLHWGSSVEVPYLHFELTYYQAIDYAIREGLDRINAGPLGDHKANRGFEAEAFSAAHWFRESGFLGTLGPGLRRRNEVVANRIAEINRRGARILRPHVDGSRRDNTAQREPAAWRAPPVGSE